MVLELLLSLLHMLYFPFSDGYNLSSTSDHNVYFVRNNILGLPVKFTGDYFGRPAEPT